MSVPQQTTGVGEGTSASISEAMPDADRLRLAGLAADMAALSNRAEHASLEVAAIEVQMHALTDELTTVAGVTLTDVPPDPALKTTAD